MKYTIIGAGDVVRQRILPAILDIASPKNISIVSDKFDDDFKRMLIDQELEFLTLADESATETTPADIVEKASKYISSNGSSAIVATPTKSHFAYISELSRRGIRFAVEKPICIEPSHLDALSEINSEMMNKGFLLSYYLLEKALSLNFFCSLNPSYIDLLNFTMGDQVVRDPVDQAKILKERLGSPISIKIEFLEGDELPERYWTELPENGGMVAETMIHALAIVAKCGKPKKKFEIEKADWLRNSERYRYVLENHGKKIGPTFSNIEGHYGDLNFHLHVGKYTGQKRRHAVIEFENGVVIADFDSMSCQVVCGNESFSISNKRSEKYVTQMLLFEKFLKQGWQGERFDDFPQQVDVVRACLGMYPEEHKIRDYGSNFLAQFLKTNKIIR